MSHVDFAYLESFTAGDTAIAVEVLGLFREQADGWLVRLANPGDGWRDLAHVIKGSAKGIGAAALGELAGEAEFRDAAMAPQLTAELTAVLADIEDYIRRAGR